MSDNGSTDIANKRLDEPLLWSHEYNNKKTANARVQ
jgi:hypothetical protein